ncbi:hypothetical protein K458DRAFT_342498 [Lentithecium fluviatile CBS 122367]|uniref:N-acetyltransferase domain-containing protein n=1 Tax=Lentithecium fluviatile CBS 122367 TaxID=1168545 RepID=A0A6G1IV58_9PLEO|nr:hypothetical protein K458DRAFT_342498 [Lentithecium fluviatile CBS 122367]
MAYGKVRGIAKPLGDIPARIYPIQTNSSETRAGILTMPFDFAAGDEVATDLVQKLYKDFKEEVEDGRTYPQEDIPDLEAYKSYFLSHDLVIGFFLTHPQLQNLHPSSKPIPSTGIRLTTTQLSTIKIGNSNLHNLTYPSTPNTNLPNPSDTYAFAYYIKPNYPGRSSHLCNGGFIVPPASRGLGLGRIAARSFLFYAPAYGYKGSVFNLVYANNEASVRLWEKLGFQNVGRIPEAGRLRKKGGAEGEEEYVDAWVVHGDFQKIGFRDKEGEGVEEGAGVAC